MILPFFERKALNDIYRGKPHYAVEEELENTEKQEKPKEKKCECGNKKTTENNVVPMDGLTDAAARGWFPGDNCD